MTDPYLNGRMFKLLSKRILKECLPSLAMSLAVLTSVLLMHRLFKLSDLIVAKGVPAADAACALALALPTLLPLVLPVGLFVSTLLAMGRLSADNEIIAMRACGVSLSDNLKPIIALSLLIMALTGWLTIFAQPASTAALRAVVFDSIKNRIGLATEAGVFSELAKGITIYSEGSDNGSKTLKNLFLHMDNRKAGSVWILADSGSISEKDGALGLNLSNGEMHQTRGAGNPYRKLQFKRYRLKIPLPREAVSSSLEEKPTAALIASVLAAKADRAERSELHTRLAAPFSCLIFGLLGGSLGASNSTRGGKGRAAGLSLAVLLAYYALFTTANVLTTRTEAPPELAMWLPNACLGSLAVAIYFIRNRQIELPFNPLFNFIFLGRRKRALQADKGQ